MTQDEAKALVGKRAAEFVEDGMAVGLGTGTTSIMFIRALGERVKAGLKIRCVASSDASTALGKSLGMDVVSLPELPELDVYIDGADEIGPGLSLIKGGGGALLREKIVASSAKRFIVVADSSKVVATLGRFPLPVEVVKMALPLVTNKLRGLGLNPAQRHHPDGSVYLTDEDNFILDCACGQIVDPAATAAAIRGVIGVVEHGLFLNMASVALIAGEDWVTERYP
ncbi:MAG TPA: ribose-5-phosphate isomerase RpiA [Acidobacteriaceae bacterium]|nr:ribose-5-phosphate isomerase RpiA [Acidobacteriaceae bacterium]